MRIQFCGADRTVTGSCHLVEVNGLRILLDLGIYQGRREEARRINQYLPERARKADVIILSHGHLDHCGKLPVATRGGFNGPIYCTPATAEVARLVLEDSAEIQVEDVQYLNRRSLRPGDQPLEPLYTPEDIPGVLRLFKRVGYGQRTDIGNGVSFTFYDAGHILGSAYVVLEWSEGGAERRLLFTADIGRYDTPIIRDPHPLPGEFDFVITESTYGNTTHAPIDRVEPQLLDAVKHVIARRSRMIVPSFAVGRSQTIMWYIQKFIHEGTIPPVRTFVDSPMAVEASKIHAAFPEVYDEQTTAMVGGRNLGSVLADRVTLASSGQQSRAINGFEGACVIIASSPSCEFGRVLHHLKRSIENENDVVVFVGWTPPETLGRRLQDAGKAMEAEAAGGGAQGGGGAAGGRRRRQQADGRRVRIYDRWYEVKCQVRTIHGLSAHADGGELLRFLGPTLVPRTKAYVVHGEVPQAEGFAQRLLKAGVGAASVPAMETSAFAYTAGPEEPPATPPGATDAD